MRNSICTLDSSWFRSIDFAQSGISSGNTGVLDPARNSAPDRVDMLWNVCSDTKIWCVIGLATLRYAGEKTKGRGNGIRLLGNRQRGSRRGNSLITPSLISEIFPRTHEKVIEIKRREDVSEHNPKYPKEEPILLVRLSFSIYRSLRKRPKLLVVYAIRELRCSFCQSSRPLCTFVRSRVVLLGPGRYRRIVDAGFRVCRRVGSITWSNHEGSILSWCWIPSFYGFLLRGRTQSHNISRRGYVNDFRTFVTFFSNFVKNSILSLQQKSGVLHEPQLYTPFVRVVDSELRSRRNQTFDGLALFYAPLYPEISFTLLGAGRSRASREGKMTLFFFASRTRWKRFGFLAPASSSALVKPTFLFGIGKKRLKRTFWNDNIEDYRYIHVTRLSRTSFRKKWPTWKKGRALSAWRWALSCFNPTWL